MSKRHYIVTLANSRGNVYPLDVFAIDRSDALKQGRAHFKAKRIGVAGHAPWVAANFTFRAALAKGCDCTTCTGTPIPAPEMVVQPVQQAQCNAGEMSDTERKAILIRESENTSRHPEARAAYRELADKIASDVPPTATVIRSAQSIRDRLNPALVARYCWQRKTLSDSGIARHNNFIRAQFALEEARRTTKDRYPSEVSVWNPGQGTERFIEQPAVCGLRFVGYADEIVNLRHTGHFTDRSYQDSIMRGVVYQMPSRRGELLFVAGYNLNDNGDTTAVLDFSHIHRESIPTDRLECEAVKDFARDAAYVADGMAERAAEQECDYQESWRAGSDYVDAGTEYREARKRFLSTMRHAKTEMDSPVNRSYREIRTQRFLSKREELMTKRAKLFSDHGNTDAFREHLPE